MKIISKGIADKEDKIIKKKINEGVKDTNLNINSHNPKSKTKDQNTNKTKNTHASLKITETKINPNLPMNFQIKIFKMSKIKPLKTFRKKKIYSATWSLMN